MESERQAPAADRLAVDQSILPLEQNVSLPQLENQSLVLPVLALQIRHVQNLFFAMPSPSGEGHTGCLLHNRYLVLEILSLKHRAIIRQTSQKHKQRKRKQKKEKNKKQAHCRLYSSTKSSIGAGISSPAFNSPFAFINSRATR